jgi:thiol:disulfide interchange protein
MSWPETVAAVIYFGGVAGSVVFVARRLSSRWWRYAEGIALLLQHVVLVGFGISAVVALTIDQNYPGRLAVTLLLLFGFSVSIWWLTYLQERARRQARAESSASQPPKTHPVEQEASPGT